MRPSIDEYMLRLAQAAASRTTCIRRGVGCVLANAKGHVLAISYNGVASGMPHCNDTKKECRDNRKEECDLGSTTQPRCFLEVTYPHACIDYDLPPGSDSCEAVHAEQNALLQCHNPWQIETAYVSLSPCKACLKLLLNTSCKRIVFLEEHIDPLPKALWLKAGRTWEQQ